MRSITFRCPDELFARVGPLVAVYRHPTFSAFIVRLLEKAAEEHDKLTAEIENDPRMK
jgi:hypothetical protein